VSHLDSWSDVRRDFPCAESRVFLNTGTLGAVAAPVMDRLLAYMREWNLAGPGAPDVYIGWRERVETARTALAAEFGCSPRDLALFGNVTDAINVALVGLRLPDGAHIITTDEEHGALVGPLMQLARRGITIDVVPFGLGGDALLERLEAAMDRTPTTLVAMSHMSCETGALVDARRLAEAAHRRGALVMLDGAQTPGQMPLTLDRWGVDLYPFNGHKWMGAPPGCGGLYLSPSVANRLQLTFTGDGAGWESDYPARWTERRPAEGRRFEYGTRNWPAWVAWGDVVRYRTELPGDAHARQRELARGLQERLRQIDGVTIRSPDPVGGIVTVSADGIGGEALYQELLAEGVVGRRVRRPHLDAVRFSVAFFNSDDDLDRAAATVAAVVSHHR
jgi:selenocysteine lyase/cysteine desulfurase